MRRATLAFTFIASLLILLSPRASLAQALADKVPADSFFYIGWKGYETPGAGYEGSHLQSVLAASNIKAAIDEALPQLLAMMEKDDPQSKENVRAAGAILGTVFRHPSALYFRPGDKNTPVRAGVICHAGADAKTLAKELTDAFARVPEAQRHLRIVESGEFVALQIGEDTSKPAEIVAAGAGLATNVNFAASMKAAGADPFVAFYADCESGLGLITKAIEQNEPSFVPKWANVREVAGLNGLRRILYTGKFDGKDWSSAAFIDAPAPRKGLIKLLEGRPVEPEVMKSIPATAASAQMARFDLAAFANEVRNIFVAVNGDEGGAMFDKGMGAAQVFAGAHPIKDILAPLGDTWIAYSDENLAGNDSQAVVFINKLDDAAAAERGFNALWAFANNMLNGPMGAGARGQLTLTQTTVQNVRISTVQTPALAINWAIHNGKLIIGMKTDGIVKAATAPPPEKGFDQNPQFAALSKKLSDGNTITSFRFTDLTVTAPIMHGEYQQSWQIARMLASGQNINLPETILPPVEVLKEHVAPAGQVSWTDATGMRSKSFSPFPGSDIFSNAPNGNSTELTVVGVSAMGVAVLLPSLNRARETANRIKCASNQRQLAQGILLYANDHKGDYPPDLGTLIVEGHVPLEVFVCPSGDNELPENADKMTPQQQAEWANQHGDFIFAGKGLRIDAPADKIIIYEKLDDHARDGINMTYADGHVEFQLMDEAEKLIEGLKDR